MIHGHATDGDRTVRDFLESCEHTKGGGLPASRRAQKDKKLAVLNREIEALHGLKTVFIPLVDVRKFNTHHVITL